MAICALTLRGKRGIIKISFPGGNNMENIPKKPKRKPTNCETCVYYDYDIDYEAYICTVNLDEDELERFVLGTAQYCPHYKFYDEYKSVQKQN